MKRVITIVMLFVALFATTSLSAQVSLNKAMNFKYTEHDFGDITENGGEVVYKFEFTNNGSAPIIINNVQAACGCTTPEWSNQPILPGQTGYITAKYNPKNRPGPFSKTITVTANVPESPITLRIIGDVK